MNRKHRFLCIIALFSLLCLAACKTGNNSETIFNENNDTNISEAQMPENVVNQESEVTNSLISETAEGQRLPLEVHFIDVGEADSALVKCGSDAMLIDAGLPENAELIHNYILNQNVSKLNHLILTHSDRDHIGGAASVIRNFDIDNIFMCSFKKNNEIYNNMMEEVSRRNFLWTTPKVGSEYTLGDAVITIVAPNREYDNPNDSSIAFVIRHGENSFIFTGDAEEDAEADIVKNGINISANVYYVGHHGSHTSSSQAFLDRVNPEYVVISCGKDNEYGHPHWETMEELANRGTKLFRTDEQGTIVCYSDGKSLSFNVEPSDNWSSGNIQMDENVIRNSEIENVQNTSITYVLNTNTMKFHLPTCDSVDDMKEKNKKDVSMTRDEVTKLGYKPCSRCKP